MCIRDRSDYLHIGRESLYRELETHLIVALARAAVADSVCALGLGYLNEMCIRDSTRGEAGLRIDDEFLYHEYIPRIIAEGSDTASLGYLLNLVIRIIPRQVFRLSLIHIYEGFLPLQRRPLLRQAI